MHPRYYTSLSLRRHYIPYLFFSNTSTLSSSQWSHLHFSTSLPASSVLQVSSTARGLWTQNASIPIPARLSRWLNGSTLSMCLPFADCWGSSGRKGLLAPPPTHPSAKSPTGVSNGALRRQAVAQTTMSTRSGPLPTETILSITFTAEQVWQLRGWCEVIVLRHDGEENVYILDYCILPALKSAFII